MSGPLLDRIDIRVDVPAVPHQSCCATGRVDSSGAIRERVAAALSVAVVALAADPWDETP